MTSRINQAPFRKTRCSSAGLREDIPSSEMGMPLSPHDENGGPFPQRGCHGDGGPLGPFAKREAAISVFCVFPCVLWTPSE